MQPKKTYHHGLRITKSTTPEEKTVFLNGFREYFSGKIDASMGDITHAQAALFEFFTHGLRTGLTIPEVFDMLTCENGILYSQAFQSSPHAKAIIDYIKTMDVGDVYNAAGVSPERDFEWDSSAEKWKPKDEGKVPEILHQLGAFEPMEAKRILPLLESNGIAFEVEADDSALHEPNRHVQLLYGNLPIGSRLAVFVHESDLPTAREIVTKLFPV